MSDASRAKTEPLSVVEYDVARQVNREAAVVLQNNPGSMTLDGTNTWLLRDPSSQGAIVVDPGQTDSRHLEAVIAAAGEVELVLLTHHHHDHAEAAPALHEATGAPVRAFDRGLCIDAEPLADHELIAAAGVEVRVLATPGHTADSVCFALASGGVLTGDSILGRGTTVVAHPDGNLADYLDSLRALQQLGDVAALPGHGPDLPSVAAVASAYLAHRAQRLDQVRETLSTLGADASARDVVRVVYSDVDESLWWAAELSVQAQLDYLRIR